VGFGLGFFVEKSGLGPFDGVKICLKPDGTVEIVTGAASLGQGVETVIAQICADVLSLPMGCFTVIHGQTDRIDDGMGAFASRVTVMTGNAAHLAACGLKSKLLAAAATALQADARALEIRDGWLQRRTVPARPSSLWRSPRSQGRSRPKHGSA
jgi:CO/xanthine dehydrogenase Mo-binding subunit